MAGVKNVLLANHLRHAGTHNKVQEEREMWRLRKMEINNSLHHTLVFENKESRAPLTRGRLLSDSYPDERVRDEVGGVGDERGGVRGSERPAESKSTYYWTRQLMKAEEADTHRWGHGGYKEHHPEEFVSTDDERGTKHKTVNGRHQAHNERKRKKKEKKRKKAKLKKLDDSSDSDACSDGSSTRRRTRLKERRAKKKKRK